MSIRNLYWMFTVVVVSNIFLALYVLECCDKEIDELKQRCEKLRWVAMTDALTGLHNRRYITDVLLPGISHSTNEVDQTLVCLIDVDNFKWFNDAHSYRTGDKVLVTVGRHIRHQSWPGDSIIRWGGDEFVWVTTSQNQTDIPFWRTTFTYYDGNGSFVDAGFCQNSKGSSRNSPDFDKQGSEAGGLKYSRDKTEFLVSLSVGCSRFEGSWTRTFTRCDDALKISKWLGKGRVTIR